jgi:hypothetical protein
MPECDQIDSNVRSLSRFIKQLIEFVVEKVYEKPGRRMNSLETAGVNEILHLIGTQPSITRNSRN